MKTCVCVLLSGTLILAFSSAPMAGGPSSPDGHSASQFGSKKKIQPKFTVAKDTTYVAGPFDKDGFIDYVYALNGRLSQGVTPDNNASVLLCQIIGPRPEGKNMPTKFYKWMGIKEPPEKGDYLKSLYQYLKDDVQIMDGKTLQDLQDEQDLASGRPWTAKQYPTVAAWLKFNDKPLSLVHTATKRTHYYYPLVPSDTATSELIAVLIPGVQKCRELANMLPARAMLHTGEGRYDEAWQDLLACHRLGRLVAKGGTLIEGLVGIAIDAIASGAEVAHLDCGKLTAQQIKDRLADLHKLPPMPGIAEKIDLTERFMMLDTLMLIPRGDAKLVAGLTGVALPEPPKGVGKPGFADVDWDPALRAFNKWCDRTAAVLRIKDRPERIKQMDKLASDQSKLKMDVMDSGQLAKVLWDAKTTPHERGKLFGDVFVAMLMPTIQKVQAASDRAEQNQRNLHVGFALAAFFADHGRYPKKLDELAPKYLTQVPNDLYTGKALLYQAKEKSFLVYSVGPNGIDEQGHWYDSNPPGDDPNVRLPLPKVKKE